MGDRLVLSSTASSRISLASRPRAPRELKQVKTTRTMSLPSSKAPLTVLAQKKKIQKKNPKLRRFQRKNQRRNQRKSQSLLLSRRVERRKTRRVNELCENLMKAVDS